MTCRQWIDIQDPNWLKAENADIYQHKKNKKLKIEKNGNVYTAYYADKPIEMHHSLSAVKNYAHSSYLNSFK